MSELQLSHIALVGARINAFQLYGITNRSELNMLRVVPPGYESIMECADQEENRAKLAAQLAITWSWISGSRKSRNARVRAEKNCAPWSNSYSSA